MLVLLGLALGARGAGAFVVQVSSWCALAPNGSALAFGLTFLFNKNPLVCYDPGARRFQPCDGGLLQHHAAAVAHVLNGNETWLQRAQQRRRLCQELPPRAWGATALRLTPPRARIVPSGPAHARAPVLLTCHVWGFYPREVTVTWLRNGDPVGSPAPPISAVPDGDWTYRTRVTLPAAPLPADTFTCAVQHAALARPLLQDWGPGLSPSLALKAAAAAAVMALGLGLLGAGVCRYRARPAAMGYAPLPGDNYPAGST